MKEVVVGLIEWILMVRGLLVYSNLFLGEGGYSYIEIFILVVLNLGCYVRN